MKRAAEILRNNSSSIMDSWEEHVRLEIPASNVTSNLALRNQLPNVLEDIAEIMNRYDGFLEIQAHEKYQEIIKNSLDHGRHRATSSHYTVEQILKEYMVFHQVLTDTLIAHDVYTKEVGIILKYSLETAMLNSASSFSNSIQEMREKLIGTLAHDIRNPISAAYFAMDIIRNDDDPERFQRLKKMGLRSLKKSIDLLEGLLDAITVKAGEGIALNFAEINIVEEIRWVYNEAVEIYSKEFVFNCDKETINGVFDGTAIRRVVENLMTNAIKYGSRGTPISLTVKDEGDMVIIEVHNSGEPIGKNYQNDIFKFLNRVQDIETGGLESWGMGLTLVKSVAHAHGGSVSLESDVKSGTTFAISLNKYANKPGKVRTELNYSDN